MLYVLRKCAAIPALRILRMSEASISGSSTPTEHKSVTGRGGHRIESSRNFWDSSGLKVDSSSTDVAWCHGGKWIFCSPSARVLTAHVSLQQQDPHECAER